MRPPLVVKVVVYMAAGGAVSGRRQRRRRLRRHSRRHCRRLRRGCATDPTRGSDLVCVRTSGAGYESRRVARDVSEMRIDSESASLSLSPPTSSWARAVMRAKDITHSERRPLLQLATCNINPAAPAAGPLRAARLVGPPAAAGPTRRRLALGRAPALCASRAGLAHRPNRNISDETTLSEARRPSVSRRAPPQPQPPNRRSESDQMGRSSQSRRSFYGQKLRQTDRPKLEPESVLRRAPGRVRCDATRTAAGRRDLSKRYGGLAPPTAESPPTPN